MKNRIHIYNFYIIIFIYLFFFKKNYFINLQDISKSLGLLNTTIGFLLSIVHTIQKCKYDL